MTREKLCRILLFAVGVAAAYPVRSYPVTAGLDASWAFGLNYAHHSGLLFGRDAIFTYGPLAWLALVTTVAAWQKVFSTDPKHYLPMVFTRWAAETSSWGLGSGMPAADPGRSFFPHPTLTNNTIATTRSARELDWPRAYFRMVSLFLVVSNVEPRGGLHKQKTTSRGLNAVRCTG